jgi:quinol-cytochrome oxidoreductase complex cytochrome b subunit
VEGLRTWLWRATVALGFVLLVTGVWLSFFYRPVPVDGNDEQLLRAVHRISSSLLVPLALALAITHVVVRRRSWPPVATGLIVIVVALVFTGYRLPWDQLALWAVTVGTDLRGMFPAAFDDQVKFVLIGSREVSQGTLRTVFIVHAAVLPVPLAACLAALRRRSSTVEATGA